MITQIKHLINILQLRSAGVKVPFRCNIENFENVKIGPKSHIDTGAIIKGGVGNRVTMTIGQSVRLRRNCYLSATNGSVEIGDYVLIAHNSWIGGRGKTTIGENTLIGPGVVIISSNHNLSSSHFPAMDAPEISGTIIIGKNTWIGANSTIVPDVSIGSGCLVAGGSVVTRNIPDGFMAAGNPASIIRQVSSKDQNLYKRPTL